MYVGHIAEGSRRARMVMDALRVVWAIVAGWTVTGHDCLSITITIRKQKKIPIVLNGGLHFTANFQMTNTSENITAIV